MVKSSAVDNGNSYASGGIYAAVNFKHLGKTEGERHVLDHKGQFRDDYSAIWGLAKS